MKDTFEEAIATNSFEAQRLAPDSFVTKTEIEKPDTQAPEVVPPTTPNTAPVAIN